MAESLSGGMERSSHGPVPGTLPAQAFVFSAKTLYNRPMAKTIVQKEDPVLREKAERVLIKDIQTPKIQKIIAEMKAALKTQDDGAALAAPQIGYSLRIFVIADNLFGSQKDARYPSQDGHLVYINPEIVKLSRKKEFMDEGCLSVRGIYGTVPRSQRATVKAHDENGKLFERGASGLLAQVFQHEVDHLNGILFIDKVDEWWEVDRNGRNSD